MAIGSDVMLGRGVVIHHPELVNLYGCKIGDQSKIAAFVEIQHGVELGRRVKVEAFVFIPTGVTIEDGVFMTLETSSKRDSGKSCPQSSARAPASEPTRRSSAA
jgi:UDP-3-O-[3-hydroxymyristoyl] glucosamine N-acyltransferase